MHLVLCNEAGCYLILNFQTLPANRLLLKNWVFDLDKLFRNRPVTKCIVPSSDAYLENKSVSRCGTVPRRQLLAWGRFTLDCGGH